MGSADTRPAEMGAAETAAAPEMRCARAEMSTPAHRAHMTAGSMNGAAADMPASSADVSAASAKVRAPAAARAVARTITAQNLIFDMALGLPPRVINQGGPPTDARAPITRVRR